MLSNQQLNKFLTDQLLKRKAALNQIPKPEVFDMEKEGSEKSFEKALSGLSIIEIVDEYGDMLEELYFSRNAPHKFQYRFAKEIPAYQDFVKELFGARPLTQTGSWVYFPWNHKLIHFLPQVLHEEIRTARNKGLVSHEEQEKFRTFKIGIAGLSIGQSAAYTLAVNGGCEEMHLADFDVISATNTNRMRASFDAIGVNKAIYASRLIYEINPYAKPKLFVDGLTEENMDTFFEGIDAVVDEIDNFPMKVGIRKEAQKRKIPVIMAADVADAVGLDVERYDLNQNQKFFNGKLDDNDLNSLNSAEFKFEDMARIFIKMNGGDKAPKKLLESTPLVGKELAGPPQLGGTAFLAGAVISYVVRKIAAGEKMDSCSAMIDLDMHLANQNN